MQDYILHLLDERKQAWSSVNVALSAFKFFYGQTLGKASFCLSLPPRKKSGYLPSVLSAEELERLFNAYTNPRDLTLLSTAYSAGLRVSELVKLKANDIHSERKQIRVEQGKGAKDRYTLLSDKQLELFRSYWRLFRPKTWLFPSNRDASRPIGVDVAQKVFSQAKKKAKLHKKENLALCRLLLGASEETKGKEEETTLERLERFFGVDLSKCPSCKEGRMEFQYELIGPGSRFRSLLTPRPVYEDTS